MADVSGSSLPRPNLQLEQLARISDEQEQPRHAPLFGFDLHVGFRFQLDSAEPSLLVLERERRERSPLDGCIIPGQSWSTASMFPLNWSS
jgi:hypothetical protein